MRCRASCVPGLSNLSGVHRVADEAAAANGTAPVLGGQERPRLSQELSIGSTLQVDPDRSRYFACCLRMVGGEIRDQVVHGTTLPGAVAHHEDGIRPGQSLGDCLVIRGLFWRSLSGAVPFHAVDEMSLIAVRVIRLDPLV